MGLFDQFSQLAGSFFGNQQQSPILRILLQMLGSSPQQGGGLGALMQSFQQKGLGNIASSWVGTGENMPISPEQIHQGLGDTMMQQMAAKTGMSTAAVSSQLSEMLPNLVDKLTPNGQMPEHSALEEVLSVLQQKFK